VKIMAERTVPFVNVAMWSGGHYSTAIKGCKEVVDGATPLVLAAIHHLPETDPARPCTLTDMGCADGGTSLEMVRQAVGAARARRPQRPITVVYADQPHMECEGIREFVIGTISDFQ
jgi:indole-3-acetate O-methyltransferase